MSLTINVHQLTSSPVKMAGFESHTNSNAEAQNRHRYRHHNIQNTLRSEDENNINEEDDDDGIVDEDGSSSMSSSPSIPDENINFDLVYALHTFTATVEGQASVVKGDALVLMEDVNIYWWLVEVLKTREIGYIPAENIETPYERLARLNKHRNVEITSPFPIAALDATTLPAFATRRVTIASEDALTTVNFYDVESDMDSEQEDTDNDEDYNSAMDSDGGDNDDGYRMMEHDLDIVQPQQQTSSNTVNPSQSMVHSAVNDNDNDDGSVTHYERQQPSAPLQQRQQKQRPCQYLNPAMLKRDSSQYSLSSDGGSKRHSLETHSLRVFGGNIGQGPLFHTFDVRSVTTTEDLLREVIERFDIVDSTSEYYIAVQGADGDDYTLGSQDKPVSIFKTLTASLTTPMPMVSQNVCRKALEGKDDATRRKRSSSFGDHGQTSYEEDSVIRFYIHRRTKRTQERQGLVYIKVSLYPDDYPVEEPVAPPYNRQLQQEFLPLSTRSSSPSSSPMFFKSKNTLTTDSIKTEIHRLDKTLPVSYDSLVGAVINTALEKLHIPNAEADGMQFTQQSSSLDSSVVLRHRHQTTKYSMATRNESGKEELLCATDTMANVLRNQRDQQVSDLLFIIRQTESALKVSKQQSLSSLSSRNGRLGGIDARSIKGSDFNFVGNDGQVPGGQLSSILDMVTNYSPESAVGRHPSVNANSTTSFQGSIKGQQQLNHTIGQQQTRSKSLPPPASDPNPSLISPTTPSKSRQVSCPDAHSETMTAINKRHGCISKNMTADSKKRKERSSFKQQLKRLINWGTFGSLKQKGSRDLTIVTTVSPDSPPTGTEKGAIFSHSALTSISSSSGKSSPDPLDKAPLQLQPSKDNQSISRPSNHDENSHCKAPPLSASTLSASPSPLDQWQLVDSAMALSNPLYDQHQGETNEQVDNDTSLPAKASTDSHISGGYTSTSTSSSSNRSESTSQSIGNSGRSSYQNDGDDCIASSSDSSEDDDKLNAQTDIDATQSCNLDGSAHLGLPLPLCNDKGGGVPARQDDFDDDFFFLVTQGVDYLKAKECTKWDDEEKGSGRSKDLKPPGWTMSNDETRSHDSALATVATTPTKLLEPPFDGTPLVDTSTVDEPQIQVAYSTTALKEPSVTDEELHWIVNSHILF